MATIKRRSDSNMADICKELDDSIRGLGANKEKLIQVLVSCDNAQRQIIKEKYLFMYNSDLNDEIKNEHSVNNDLKTAIFALLLLPHEYDAESLYNSLHVMRSNEKLTLLKLVINKTDVKLYEIIEIMVTRNHEELKLIQEAYRKRYQIDLDEDFQKNHFLSRSLIKLLRSIAIIKRSEDQNIDKEKSIEDANILLHKEKIGFSYEDQLIHLFTDRSFSQLAQILDEYSNLSGKDLRDTIQNDEELDKDFKECMYALIDCAIDMPTYFAKRIHCYLNYIYGAKVRSSIRIIVSRSEKDLQLIKDRYYNLYFEMLADMVEKKTSGHLKIILKKILGN